MEMPQNGQPQALFERVFDDGSRCAFVILPRGGWAITCNEARLAVGTSDRSSIDAGVKQFRAMARAALRPPECNPFVRRQLDRIEAGNPRPVGAHAANLTQGQTDHAKRYPLY